MVTIYFVINEPGQIELAKKLRVLYMITDIISNYIWLRRQSFGT